MVVSDASRGKSGDEWEGSNLDISRFVQLVRFHVHDITRLTIDTTNVLHSHVLPRKAQAKHN
jgi:hypothetical protein